MYLRFFYVALLYLLSPLILLRLLFRGFRARSYWQRWGERFGYFESPQLTQPIWFHAVSVGETLAAVPLVKQLQRLYPHRTIVLTTMTPTGSARVKAAFGDTVFHVYAPYDFPFAIRHFLKRIQPSLLIIMETELWPNWIEALHKQHIPIFLANARLSQRSAKAYQLIKPMMKTMLNHLTQIAAQTEHDATRFIQLGASPDKVRVVGNLKFDRHIPDQSSSHSLRQRLGISRPCWIAASTHKGEESLLLNAVEIIQKAIPSALLILVPRHPERFDAVKQLILQRGMTLSQHSKGVMDPNCDVYLGDTMGDLLELYTIADVAFVGGSLVKRGGHNTLEPAALGKPILVGPYTFNFQAVTELLTKVGALHQMETDTHLAEAVINLLTDPDECKRRGKSARQVVKENSGALERHMDMIVKIKTA